MPVVAFKDNIPNKIKIVSLRVPLIEIDYHLKEASPWLLYFLGNKKNQEK